MYKRQEDDTEETDSSDPWDAVDEQEAGTTEKEDDSADGGVVFGKYPMQYLDKMTALCKRNNIQLVLIKAPSLAPQWYDSEDAQVVELSLIHI